MPVHLSYTVWTSRTR